MRCRAGIIGAAVLGQVACALAQYSPYSSMAVPGGHNGWDTTPSMVLVADNTWVTTQTLSSANGGFKFAANNGWAVNWGGNAQLARVPAVAAAPDLSGADLAYSGFTSGPYRFIFNDSTLEFRVEWVGGTPLPPPGYTNMAVVGDFNGWTANANSLLTNSPGNTNLWAGTITLENSTTFQFQPNGNASDQWGAPVATALTLPVTNGNAAGKFDFSLSGFSPGTFHFTLNTTNAAFSINQVSTQTFTITTMTAQGNFIATNNPPPNMMKIGESLWESDHFITNSGTITLRFAANSGMARWGATNGTPSSSLPASGTMFQSLTNYMQVTGISTGRYRITFDHVTGAYAFRRLYLESAGVNLLRNPGFEQTTEPGGGDAVGWNGFQSWPKRVADGFGPHSGNWLGAIHAKWFEDWTDFASFSQYIPVVSGKTYLASAWLKATPDWTASSMQIKIEWQGASGIVGADAIVDIPSLTTNWVKYSVEAVAPANATNAQLVILCSGSGTSGTMHVDDAEFRLVAGRTQNFDTWGVLQSYAPYAPDWSISSGKVFWNVAPGRPAAEVFISQYVEGTGNNKAIEIYNGTLTPIDLSADGYVLQQYDNGALSPTTTIPLTGTLPPGETLVVGRPSTGPYSTYAPDLAISGLPNLLTNKALTFNGDDAVVLNRNGTVIDRVGQVGANAVGSIWSRATTDRTLTRKLTVFTGTTTAVTAAFPIEQWNVYSSDTFTGLGSHDISYLDPNQPYTPAGYSLMMNVGATLMSGDMPGGVGDVSFWWRTESMSPPVTMVIETAPAENGPWTTNDVLAGVASSNFAYYAVFVNSVPHTWMRIRQTDGGTNRFRIDEINVSAPVSIRRLEDFNAWTDPSYAIPGNYSRYGWSIQSASIVTGALLNTRGALLSPPNGAVASPAYSDGAGEVLFWAKPAGTQSSQLILQSSTDGGSNWYNEAKFAVTSAATHSKWLYYTNPAQIRIVFDPDFDSDDVIVDNVDVRAPILYRNQNFDSWPTRGSYTTETVQGWFITNCIVDGVNAYQGQVARLNTTVGNYIQSPELPGGLGPISFRIAKWSTNDAAFTLQLQVSPNGTSWTTLTNVSASSTSYEQITYFLEDTTNRFVRLFHSAGAVRVLVDDIRVGVVTPRPHVIVTPGIDPAAPATNQAVQITADVIARSGASILSVTGLYRIAFGPWVSVEMIPVGFGSYASISNIPAVAANVDVRYHVRVQYAGIGANPAFQGYATNLHVTATNLYKVSSVRKGDVWINEIAYLNSLYDFWEEDFEYIELCGVAGANIGGWTIQLAFGADRDIAANGGNPIYASYKIPPGMVFTNQHNGFGFYVLGDQELKDAAEPINQVLTVTVPTNVVPFADEDRNHLHNVRGVIRLLNENSNLVYALSYEGSATGADRILTSQAVNGTNSVSLVGSGSSYAQFSGWVQASYTIGAVNEGQTLIPQGDVPLAVVWHEPTLHVTPLNPAIAPFYMRDPINAQSKSNLVVHYGFPSALYDLPGGTLHYRRIGYGWSAATMSFLLGSLDASDYAYSRGTIPLRTYPRGSTIEYVIEAVTGGGAATTYIGYDLDEGYKLFDNLDTAKATPFSYTYQILPEIYVDQIGTNASSWIFYTGGNDILEPFVNFRVRATTNLLTPLHQWATNAFTNSPMDEFGANTFVVPKDTASNLFYRIQPLWP